MFVRALSSSSARRAATALGRLGALTALTFALAPIAHAQESADTDGPRKREPVVFSVDVAEDLAGKFVPTFVKPEHSQPERGSFFVTEGRVFPAGTIQGDGKRIRTEPVRRHRRVDLPRHAFGRREPDPRGASVGQFRAAVRARPSRQGVIGDGRHRGQRHGHAHRHRWRGELCGLDRRADADVSGLQPDWRRQPARHLQAAPAESLALITTRRGAARGVLALDALERYARR